MKALWAFEPFHQDKEHTKGMYSLLKQLAGSPSNVELGFLLTRNEPAINLAFDIPMSERFTTFPRQLVHQELKKSGIKIDDKKIHVVDYPTLSDTKAVDRFLKIASDNKAELIGLFTHAKKGFSRLVVGSFAETAIHRSKVSLLILNPQMRVATQIKKVLFASDFSPASKKQLKTVIAQCKKLKAHLTVIHHAEIIFKWSLDESNPNILGYRQSVHRMKDWVEQECKKAKVNVDVTISTDYDATSNLVFKNTKKRKIDLVIVCAKASPVLALMGGSITRQIVRGSSAPVLVLK